MQVLPTTPSHPHSGHSGHGGHGSHGGHYVSETDDTPHHSPTHSPTNSPTHSHTSHKSHDTHSHHSSHTNHTNHSHHSARHTHTHLTYSRHHLIDIAKSTIHIAESGQYTNALGRTVDLKRDLDWAVRNCVHYGDDYDFDEALREFYGGDGGDGDGDGDGGGGRVEEVERSARCADGAAGAIGDTCSLSNHHTAPLKFERTSFLVVSASWLEAASELIQAHSTTAGNNSKRSGFSSFLEEPRDFPTCRESRESRESRDSRSSSGGSVVFASSLRSSHDMSGMRNSNNSPNSTNPTNSTNPHSAASPTNSLHSANPNYLRIGVLNSASSTTPGGRFLKGTVSQEDCLCRASLLYSCISQPKFQSENRFYGKNRSLRYGSSNCVIFSPDVPVIREDTVEGKLLDNYQKVSFVTIPAPNAFTTSSTTGKEYNDIETEDRQSTLSSSLHSRRNSSMTDVSSLQSPNNPDSTDPNLSFQKKYQALRTSLSDRIHRALSAFVLGRCTDLVLPAFGCGVHGNDPELVAEVFREMLTGREEEGGFGGRFRTVVFAIPPSRKQNYQAFERYFQRSGGVGGGVVEEQEMGGDGALKKPTLGRAETIS